MDNREAGSDARGPESIITPAKSEKASGGHSWRQRIEQKLPQILGAKKDSKSHKLPDLFVRRTGVSCPAQAGPLDSQSEEACTHQGPFTLKEMTLPDYHEGTMRKAQKRVDRSHSFQIKCDRSYTTYYRIEFNERPNLALDKGLRENPTEVSGSQIYGPPLVHASVNTWTKPKEHGHLPRSLSRAISRTNKDHHCHIIPEDGHIFVKDGQRPRAPQYCGLEVPATRKRLPKRSASTASDLRGGVHTWRPETLASAAIGPRLPILENSNKLRPRPSMLSSPDHQAQPRPALFQSPDQLHPWPTGTRTKSGASDALSLTSTRNPRHSTLSLNRAGESNPSMLMCRDRSSLQNACHQLDQLHQALNEGHHKQNELEEYAKQFEDFTFTRRTAATGFPSGGTGRTFDSGGTLGRFKGWAQSSPAFDQLMYTEPHEVKSPPPSPGQDKYDLEVQKYMMKGLEGETSRHHANLLARSSKHPRLDPSFATIHDGARIEGISSHPVAISDPPPNIKQQGKQACANCTSVLQYWHLYPSEDICGKGLETYGTSREPNVAVKALVSVFNDQIRMHRESATANKPAYSVVKRRFSSAAALASSYKNTKGPVMESAAPSVQCIDQVSTRNVDERV